MGRRKSIEKDWNEYDLQPPTRKEVGI